MSQKSLLDHNILFIVQRNYLMSYELINNGKKRKRDTKNFLQTFEA